MILYVRIMEKKVDTREKRDNEEKSLWKRCRDKRDKIGLREAREKILISILTSCMYYFISYLKDIFKYLFITLSGTS